MLRKPTHLLRHFTIMNLILLGAVIYAADYTIFNSFSVNTSSINTKFALLSNSASKQVEEKKDEAEQKPSPSPAEYTMIAEHNPFHPERIIPLEKKAGPELPKPEFVLYGTLITDHLTLAYMEDKKSPQATPGREKRQTPVRKGEALSGYILKEVMSDKVVMARGDEFINVSLNDSKTREFASAQPGGAVQPAGAAQPAGASVRPPSGPSAGPSSARRGRPSSQSGAPGSLSESSGQQQLGAQSGATGSSSPSGQQPSAQTGSSSSSSGPQETGPVARRRRNPNWYINQMSTP